MSPGFLRLIESRWFAQLMGAPLFKTNRWAQSSPFPVRPFAPQWVISHIMYMFDSLTLDFYIGFHGVWYVEMPIIYRQIRHIGIIYNFHIIFTSSSRFFCNVPEWWDGVGGGGIYVYWKDKYPQSRPPPSQPPYPLPPAHQFNLDRSEFFKTKIHLIFRGLSLITAITVHWDSRQRMPSRFNNISL